VFKGETYFHKMWESARDGTMTPKCTPFLGIALMQELQMFKTLVGKVNKHQIGPLGHHWKGLEA